MNLRRLGPGTFEGRNPHDGIDFHIRREITGWRVDVFDSNNPDPDEAHLTSDSFPTWREALDYVRSE